MPLRGGEAVPSDGLCSVLRNTLAVLKHEAQAILSACMPICRCKAVESHSLGMVLRNTSAVVKHDAQVDLSACMPLCRCKAVESRSLGIVLRNTTTTVIVARSNHILPKAAARRRALPSQRKPSRCISRNTIAPSVAAGECALAVRAAQRRPS